MCSKPRLARCPLEERGWAGGTLEKKEEQKEKKVCRNEQKRESARGKVLPYVSERKTRGSCRLLTLRVWLNDARRHQWDERGRLACTAEVAKLFILYLKVQILHCLKRKYRFQCPNMYLALSQVELDDDLTRALLTLGKSTSRLI